MLKDKQNLGTSVSYEELVFKTANTADANVPTSHESTKSEDYRAALSIVRKLLTEKNTQELAECITDEETKDVIRKLILDYVKSEALKGGFNDPRDFAESLFKDIVGLGEFENYLPDDSVEEINGNAWNDHELITIDGWKKIDLKFQTPQHAIDMVNKLVGLGGKKLDSSTPVVDSYIGEAGLRISAAIHPVVDESVGVVYSIRRQKMKIFTMEDLINKGTIIQEQFDLLKLVLGANLSIGVGGETGSGKTALVQSVLKALAMEGELRIITVEEDTREMNLICHDDVGNIISRVIHLKTRPDHEIASRDINTAKLLKLNLRLNPDIIVPAEMRGEEAMTAQEAARTGHSVITSFHTNNVTDGYFRILTMCMMSGTHLSEDLMLKLIVRAFPFMLVVEKLADRSRKITKIFEGIDYDAEQKKIVGRLIYRYKVTDKEIDDKGRITKIIGEHRKVGCITNRTAQHLYEKGVDLDIIMKYAEPGFDPNTDTGFDDDFIEA